MWHHKSSLQTVSQGHSPNVRLSQLGAAVTLSRILSALGTTQLAQLFQHAQPSVTQRRMRKVCAPTNCCADKIRSVMFMP